jgi:hypothetical protein
VLVTDKRQATSEGKESGGGGNPRNRILLELLLHGTVVVDIDTISSILGDLVDRVTG